MKDEVEQVEGNKIYIEKLIQKMSWYNACKIDIKNFTLKYYNFFKIKLINM